MPYGVVARAAPRSSREEPLAASTETMSVDYSSPPQPVPRPRTTNDECKPEDCKRAWIGLCCVLPLIACIPLFITGAINLGEAARDKRSDLLATYRNKIVSWRHSKGPQFMSLGISLKYPSGPQPMRAERVTLAPSYFGEPGPFLSDFPVIQDYKYFDYVRCPGGIVNRTCAIQMVSSSGRTLLKTSIMPLMQVGPTVHTIQSGLCQWYDDRDKWHPMAAMGMGYCDANHGPSRCVLDHYLDAYGCPTDVIQSTQLVHAGWGQWATQVNQKKRFAYEGGKCWDYTDCFCHCESSGFTFKTDTTQGYGFTGYGYWYGNTWYPFTKPFAQMSGQEKAQQCHAAFQGIGHQCAAEDVTLQCFYAGGYPKKPCSSYCKEMDTRTGTYTPPTQFVTMSTYYGPWGSQGSYPTYHNVPGMCHWTTTHTEQITKLHLVTKSDGSAEISSKYVERKKVDVGDLPFPTPIGPFVNVELWISSIDGPSLQAKNLLNGCVGLKPTPDHKCFGRDAKELQATGDALMAVGGGCLFWSAFTCISVCALNALTQRRKRRMHERAAALNTLTQPPSEDTSYVSPQGSLYPSVG